MKNRINSGFVVMLFFLFLGNFSAVKAQQQTFYKEYNDNGFITSLFPLGIIQTSDGGYLFFTDYRQGANQQSALLIKTNAAGDTTWTRFITDSLAAHATIITSAIELPNGQGYMLTGYFIDPFMMSSTSNGLIFRMDAAGNMLWMKEIFDNPGYICWLKSSCLAFDGNIVISGMGMFNNVFATTLVLKVTPTGSVVWVRKIGAGLAFDANPQQLLELPDHSIILLTDSFTVNVNRAAMLVKMDANGAVLWAKTYSSPGIVCIATSLSAGPGNTLLLSGSRIMVSNNMVTGFMMSLDSSGVISWYKQYGSWSINNSGIRKTFFVNNNIMGLTATPDSGQLFMADNSGVIQWVKGYSSGSVHFFATDLISTSDGGYALVAADDNYSGVVMKTDAAGNMLCHSASSSMVTNIGSISTYSFILASSQVSLPETIPAVEFSYGINTTAGCTSTGLSNAESPVNSCSIGPVPFSDQLTVSIDNSSQLEIKLYDITGKEIVRQTFIHQLTLNTGNLSKGVYLYTIFENGVSIKKGKVLKG